MAEEGFDRANKLERDWKTMIMIAHDFFHSWRQVLQRQYGESITEDLTLSFWEQVGKKTAAQYARGKIDPQNVEQVARGAARSSEIMGETVSVRQDGEAWLLIHDNCPWIDTYKMAGSEGKCQPGCDRWFETTVRALSPGLAVETLACLASGDNQCVRKFYKNIV